MAHTMSLIVLVKNFWSFWWLSFENCNFICSVTYTSFIVLDKLFLSCSLPDFQNSNPVMFTPLHIRYYWLYLTPKLSKNLKIRKFQILSKMFAWWIPKICSLPGTTEANIYWSRQIFTIASLFIEIPFSSPFSH